MLILAFQPGRHSDKFQSMLKFFVFFLFLTCTSLLAAPIKDSDKDKQKLQARPVQLTKDGEKWAQKTLKKMSVEEKIGQLIMVRALAEFQNVESPAYNSLHNDIHKYHLGSVIITVRVDGPFLLRNQPYEAAVVTNRLQHDSELPLLVAADFERGLSMRLMGTPFFPHAMAFGAAGKPAYAEAFGRIVARESRAIGVHWNFFPVADVNSNPENPVINTRSFGEDPQQVGDLLAAYIRGSREGGMLSTAKHFPGHGDTSTDSHLELARVGGTIEHLRATDLPPFQKAIDAGVDSIMVAHVTVPALEPDPNRVATISSKIITDLLIHDMHFGGIVVTDAMDMKALTSIYKSAGTDAAGRAAVDAFKAGNDMIILPSDLDGAYNGLLRAAKSGEITNDELNSRVLKVLRAKASLGLHKARLVDLDSISELVAKPADLTLAQEIADAAVALVRDNGQALSTLSTEFQRRHGTSVPRGPYDMAEQPGEGVFVLILTDDMRGESGRGFEREVRQRIPDAKIMFVDNRVAAAMRETAVAAAVKAKAVIVAAYVVPTTGKMVSVNGVMKNSVALVGDNSTLMERILQSAGKKTAMVAMGNPYLAGEFPTVQTYICTFSNSPTSETAAVKALFGEIPFRGKLPVTLPNIAVRGTGLEHSAMAQGRVAQPTPAAETQAAPKQ
ncbi:MAG: glycoside hydrolase, family 3-like protein [Acidobacteriaceae bacterium]|nr:glycoside hydrolase, family 3-like protein [Acidobacteriaceae bacterium]